MLWWHMWEGTEEVQLHSVLTSALEGNELSIFTPQSIEPWVKMPAGVQKFSKNL
jgi:hypothetical protein